MAPLAPLLASLLAPLLAGWLAALAGAAALWLLALRLRDVSIVDIAWGPAFLLLALIYRAHGPAATLTHGVQLAMVALWALRLAAHLAVRSRGRGEDRRYAEMRRRGGASFRWRSLLTVFALQATIATALSLPFLLVQTQPDADGFGPPEVLGLLLWAVGLAWEAVADWQLLRFQRAGEPGRVMDRGLWRYSRHPNYFGESLLWWGFASYALGASGGPLALLAAAGVTLLVSALSGIPPAERGIAARRPGYAEYAARTSAFLPLPPRRPGPGRDPAR